MPRICSFFLLLLTGGVLPLSAQVDFEARVDSLFALDDYPGVAEAYGAWARSLASNDPVTAGDYALAAAEFWGETDTPEAATGEYDWIQSLPSDGNGVDSIKALALHLHGVYHHRTEDYPAAFTAYRRSIALRDEIFPAGHNDRAKTRYNLGTAYRQRSLMDSAAYFLEASHLHYASLAEPDTLRWIRALTSLGLVYADRNDVQLLESASDRAVQLALRYYADRPGRVASVYYLVAQGAFVAQQSDRAVTNAEASMRYARLAADPARESEALNLMAGAYLADDDFDAALRSNLRLIDLWNTIGATPEEWHILYHNLGLCYAELGQYEAAKKAARKSLEGVESDLDAEDLSRSYELLGFVARESGALADAEVHFDKALKLLLAGRSVSRDLDSLSTAELKLLADIAEDRAQLYQRTKELDRALLEYEVVFEVLDRIRLDLDSETSQRFVSERLRPFFQRGIQLRYQLYERDGEDSHLWEALALAERSKAFSLLLSTIRGRDERPRRERELNRQIARLERGEASEANVAALATARLELARLEGLRNEASVALPTLDADRLRTLLADRQLHLFEFALGEENGFLFHVTPEGNISVYELRLGIGFPGEVAGLRAALEASAYKELSVRSDQTLLDGDFTGAAFSMFSKIFPPFAATAPPAGNWLIVPDGVLGYVPFGTLMTESVTPPVDYRSLPYLQRDRLLRYSYSAQYLLELAERNPVESERNLLALAPSFRGGGAPGVRGASALSRGERAIPGLLPLRYNTEEINRIAELLPLVDTYLADEATRTRFETLASKYRVLHLSSHAFVNADDPNLSFIAFSQRGDSLETDEMLFLNDLRSLSLGAEMAVLSACETNLGEFAPGEGILSMARAFAQAGARSTLTTLWKVDDEATMELMVAFYAALEAGQSRAEALATAQEKIREEGVFAHPYYWSALTLYGEADELALRTPFPYLYLGGGVVVLLGLIWRLRRTDGEK